jgi:hypothetical protein
MIRTTARCRYHRAVFFRIVAVPMRFHPAEKVNVLQFNYNGDLAG